MLSDFIEGVPQALFPKTCESPLFVTRDSVVDDVPDVVEIAKGFAHFDGISEAVRVLIEEQ